MFRNPFKRRGDDQGTTSFANNDADAAGSLAPEGRGSSGGGRIGTARDRRDALNDPMSIEAVAGFDPHADEPIAEAAPGDDPLISIEHLGSTAVATIIQPELMGETAERLGAQLVEVLRHEPKVSNLVIDFQDVEYIDSACLNMFIRLMGTFRDHGGKIAIASCKDRVEGLFRLTRLDQLFPVRRSVLDAVEALERKAA